MLEQLWRGWAGLWLTFEGWLLGFVAEGLGWVLDFSESRIGAADHEAALGLVVPVDVGAVHSKLQVSMPSL